MPQKTLTIFPTIPNLAHKFNNPISKSHLPFKTHILKSTIIVHKSTITSNSDPLTHGSGSDPDPKPEEGDGPSAPTRGHIFLEYHQAKEVVLANNKEKKIKWVPKKVVNSVTGCYGCGAPLQTHEVDAPGYVDLDTYQLKKKHYQLRTILCGRCRLLSHGHMIAAVGEHGGYAGRKQFVTAEELRDKLSHVRHEKALIVKLVDIVDLNGSFLSRVRNLAGANPIILVVTKIDLLPKGTDMNCIGDWVVEATTKKKLNVLSVHLTSSKSLVGITGVVAEIQREKKGSANVGKSAFINAALS